MKRLVWVVCLLVMALIPVERLAAHGGGKQQLAGEDVGSYRVYVWTSPEPWRVGDTHTTVAVTRFLDTQEETPATGLQIFVTYTQGSQSDRLPAVEQAGAQAGYYEADGAVGAPGDWQVTVEVMGSEGHGAAVFTEAVLPANDYNWWLIGGGILFALLLIGFFGTRRAGLLPAQRGANL